MPNWTTFKLDVLAVTGLTDDVVHVFTGLLLLVVAALLLRRPPWHWLPFATVALAETLNEIYDLFQTAYPTGEATPQACLHDWWVTMLWPAIILLAFPWFARHEQRGRIEDQPPE